MRVVLLDVGNTIAFLDVEAVAAIVREQGIDVDPARLRLVEGRAKRRYESLMKAGVSHEAGWGLYLSTLLEEAGLSSVQAGTMIEPLRCAHEKLNLWRSVPIDLSPALDRVRNMGVRIGIVSNSEGRLPELLTHVGLAHYFEAIIDSHHEGVRKPDPEIFRRALDRMRVSAEDVVYLGDIPGVDVEGANAAGIRAVLVDPFDFYSDFPGERTASVAAWITDALA